MKAVHFFSISIIVSLLCIIIIAGCSEDEIEVGEEISVPDSPLGPDTVYCEEEAVFDAAGAVSTMGHQLEYRFDFDAEGDHVYGDWYITGIDTFDWQDPDTHVVKAQARCIEHNDVLSPWSEGRTVVVIEAPVSKPWAPVGPLSTETDEQVGYSSGGAVSKDGDPLEYRFDFDAEGSRDTTSWSEEASVTHSWPVAGTYVVKAQARSSLQTDEVSLWSDGTTVTVNNRFVSTPLKPTGASAIIWEKDLYCTGGAISSDDHPIEYQFSFLLVEYDPLENDYTVQDEWLLAWNSDSCVYFTWPESGTYHIKARARSAIETHKQSAWSQMLIAGTSDGTPPEIQFETLGHPYNPDDPDTVGMFRPFSISYHGTTPNGSISAYSFTPAEIYLEGQDRWMPNLGYPVIHNFPNVDDPVIPGAQALASGPFYFGAQCLDSGGFSSGLDFGSRRGFCSVVVNYDPDTRISSLGLCTPLGGEPYLVDFSDAMPDTLPYNSLLTFQYIGWDDMRDSLQFTGPDEIPMRYQFRYSRWAEGGIAMKTSTWYPYTGPEDTDCYSDYDSTTMRVGTFEYLFLVRAFDEQNRCDGTPDTVNFFGNFPPTIDSLQIGFWDPDILEGPTQERVFRQIQTDTLYFGWIGGSPAGSGFEERVDRGDTLYIDDVSVDASSGTMTKYYRFVVRAFGHDDPRDPTGPDAGIKSWMYSIDDLGGGDYPYEMEREWIFDSPTWDPEQTTYDVFEHEVSIAITIPLDIEIIKGDSLVQNPPEFFGDQAVTLTGKDLNDSDIFYEAIRGISPVYDSCELVSPGDWIQQTYSLFSVTRTGDISAQYYFKMVM